MILPNNSCALCMFWNMEYDCDHRCTGTDCEMYDDCFGDCLASSPIVTSTSDEDRDVGLGTGRFPQTHPIQWCHKFCPCQEIYQKFHEENW